MTEMCYLCTTLYICLENIIQVSFIFSDIFFEAPFAVAEGDVSCKGAFRRAVAFATI